MSRTRPTAGGTVAGQLVGDQVPWETAPPVQQLAEETDGGATG